MDLNIDYKQKNESSLGYSAYMCIRNNTKTTFEIIFTKGKIEVETELIERINFYQYSMNIVYKDKTIQFVNLQNVTQIV